MNAFLQAKAPTPSLGWQNTVILLQMSTQAWIPFYVGCLLNWNVWIDIWCFTTASQKMVSFKCSQESISRRTQKQKRGKGGSVVRACTREHSPPTNMALVRVLASYVTWDCCWFSPLLREIFLRVLQFSPLFKNQHSKFQFDQESGRREPPSGSATSKSLFIFLKVHLYFAMENEDV